MSRSYDVSSLTVTVDVTPIPADKILLLHFQPALIILHQMFKKYLMMQGM